MKHLLILILLMCVSISPAYAEPEKEITVDLGGDEQLEMVLIPAGSFMMGDARGERDEYPLHEVKITQPFYMAKYELTQQQWSAVMNAGAPGKFQSPQHPVESLHQTTVLAFFVKLNEKLGGKPFGKNPVDLGGTPATYRLPTEAEWEYACRAGSNTRYSFGDDPKDLGEYAWYYENSEGHTHPVGQKKPNAWGLCDMHGNVWEMCRDEYFADYYTISPANNPLSAPLGTGYRSVTVTRGGGWNYSAKSCRSGDRGHFITLNDRENSNNMGFRVSRSVEEK